MGENARSPGGSLQSVSLKLKRAATHLREIKSIDATFANVQLTMPFIRDQERRVGYFEVKLPDPPEAVSPVVGDCLHNLRSSLDYLIWQTVRSNPPHTPGRKNMFPICRSQTAFDDQVRRGRLDGVPQEAAAAIQSLQPFSSPGHPLTLLDDLYNADKHRDLSLTVSVASDVDVVHVRNGQVFMRTVISGEELRNGAVFGDMMVSLEAVPSDFKIEVVGRAAAFLAFKGRSSHLEESLPVVQTLEEILSFLENSVVPSFWAFIR